MAEELVAVFDDYAPPEVEVEKEKPPAVKAAPAKTEEPVLEIPDVEPEKEEKELDPYEERARALGWKPKAEWTGDPRKYRDIEPRVWVESEPLAKAYQQSKDTVRKQQKTIQALQQHYKVVHETAYRKAFEDLQVKKDAAVLEQDVEKVRLIDAEINATRSQQLKTAPVVEDTLDPGYTDWLGTDYGKRIHEDPYMWAQAVKFEKGLFGDESLTVEDRLQQVEDYIKYKFPDKFSNPRRQAAQMVEGSAQSVSNNGGVKRFSANDLTRDEREMMHYLVESKTVTKDEYLKDIQEQRGGQKTYTIGD